MGWASGSSLFSEVIASIQPEIPDDEKRKTIYTKLIAAFEDSDWDTQNECLGEDPAYDAALKELHPDWYT
jgi:hypothetical protein